MQYDTVPRETADGLDKKGNREPDKSWLKMFRINMFNKI